MPAASLALAPIENFYSEKFKEHGADYRGVDWTSKESQEARFAQLIKVCDFSEHISLNDLGCGYGALYEYLGKLNHSDLDYSGYDICAEMIAAARTRLQSKQNVQLFHSSKLEPADYTLSSGIFNVKTSISDEAWLGHVVETLNDIDARSQRGFAFNMLSKYTDPELRKDGYYYGEPTLFFELCMSKYSKDVSLLHGYGLSEFTIIVGK